MKFRDCLVPLFVIPGIGEKHPAHIPENGFDLRHAIFFPSAAGYLGFDCGGKGFRNPLRARRTSLSALVPVCSAAVER
jgi:hypothetical protein